MSSSPSADLSYAICIVRYAIRIVVRLIAPLIHLVIAVVHCYYWQIYIWLDNLAPCFVYVSLVARNGYIAGVIPSSVLAAFDPGPVQDRLALASRSVESMRALGKQDVLHMTGAAKAAAGLALSRVQRIIIWSPDTDTAASAADRGSASSSMCTKAVLATVVLVLVLLFVLCLVVRQQALRSGSDKMEPAGVVDADADADGPEPTGTRTLLASNRDRLLLEPAEPYFAQTGRRASPTTAPAWALSLAAPVGDALSTIGNAISSAFRKSSDCVVDMLAPLIFGALLMGTTAAGIVLYGVGHVGIAKIAESGIFGLNEDAIDTLLEMIQMQWRLMRQLKWSWWLSVGGRYEARCQHGFRLHGHGGDSEPEHEHEHEHEPEHVHDHHICPDSACPFRHVAPHKPPKQVAHGDQRDAGIAKPKTTADEGHHHHHHHHNDHHHSGQAEHELPREHINLETRRDWLRWLILGKDGNGSHYRDRHPRHRRHEATCPLKAAKSHDDKAAPGQASTGFDGVDDADGLDD